MNHTMTRELADAARRCDTADVKAVVLTGAWSPRRCRTANSTSAPRRLADGSRHSHGAVTLLSASSNNGPDEQLELEGRLISEQADSADGRDGVDAFLAKRRPDFC